MKASTGRKLTRVMLATALMILTGAAAGAQDRELIREVMGSGGEIMRSDQHTAHGTISQTTIGRMVRPGAVGNHNVGFWYWAREFGAFACVRLPKVAADPGTRISIPLILEKSNDLLQNGPLPFRVRIRFNGTLLEPAGATPPCEWEGDDCIIEYEGVATSEIGLLAEFEFIAKLGDNINTPLIIEEFVWLVPDDRAIRTLKKHGEFTLLGVCRVGDDARLIIANGVIARISAMPNPAATFVTIEFVTGEDGRALIHLVDGLGNQQATLVDQTVEGTQLYQAGVDLTGYSSGSYFLVLQTPTVVRTTPLIIQQ